MNTKFSKRHEIMEYIEKKIATIGNVPEEKNDTQCFCVWQEYNDDREMWRDLVQIFSTNQSAEIFVIEKELEHLQYMIDKNLEHPEFGYFIIQEIIH